MKKLAVLLVCILGFEVWGAPSDTEWIQALPKKEGSSVQAPLAALDALLSDHGKAESLLRSEIDALYLEYDSLFVGLGASPDSKGRIRGAVSGFAFSLSAAQKELSRIERKARDILVAFRSGTTQVPFRGKKKNTVKDIRGETVTLGKAVLSACKSLDALDESQLESFCLAFSDRAIPIPLRREVLRSAFADPDFAGKTVRLALARSLCLMETGSVLSSAKESLIGMKGKEGKRGLKLVEDLASFKALDEALLYESPAMMTVGAMPSPLMKSFFVALGILDGYRNLLLPDPRFCIPSSRLLARLKAAGTDARAAFGSSSAMDSESFKKGMQNLESWLGIFPPPAGIQEPSDSYASLVCVRKAEAEYRLLLASGDVVSAQPFSGALSAVVRDPYAVRILAHDPFFAAFRNSLSERYDLALQAAIDAAVHAATVSPAYKEKVGSATGGTKPVKAEIKGERLRSGGAFRGAARLMLVIRLSQTETISLPVTDTAPARAFSDAWSDAFFGSGQRDCLAAGFFCPALVTGDSDLGEIVLFSGTGSLGGAGAVSRTADGLLPLIPSPYLDSFARATRDEPFSRIGVPRTVMFIKAVLIGDPLKDGIK